MACLKYSYTWQIEIRARELAGNKKATARKQWHGVDQASC